MKKIIFVLFLYFSLFNFVKANDLPDDDFDGIPNQDEINIYKTDPRNNDTDGDGYSDRNELLNGYSPLNKEKISLEKNDYDKDGLSDRMELNFKTDLSNPDTDGDGIKDGDEIKNFYNPLSKEKIKLEKRIEINTGAQELSYFLGGIRMGKFSVSSGKPSMPTPKGNYKIINKHPKAWSGSYGLWMPYWMGLGTGKFGLHELPIWPNGYREGENHLGKAVSHGCVRLGIGSAEFLYNWSEIGTEVFIY